MKLLLKAGLYACFGLAVLVILVLVPLPASYPLKNRAGVWLYEQGHHEAAFALFQSLSSLGHAPAANNLGVLANLGLGTKQRFGEAFALYERAAEAGVIAAKYNLARLYERGLGTLQDLDRAETLLAEAAAAGNPFARITLARLVEQRRRPGWQARKEDLLRQAAEGGHPEAQYALGMLFYQDDQVPIEEQARRSEKIMAWWQDAARQDHGPAQASLAVVFQESDPVQALHWLRRAAENGIASAQLGLAQRLATGKDLTQDYEAAASWYRKVAAAAERPSRSPVGWPDLYAYHHPRLRPAQWQAVQVARLELAELHLAGLGVARDPERAAALLQSAAEAGWGQAAVKLAELFRRGEGVPQDLDQTRRWLRAAVEAGYRPALPQLEALEAELEGAAPAGDSEG
ncbi:MAG: tetratricopeptide repeat protein [Kiloniellales bacterium]|nr:tetratricopeptide repeat protein [Kiloniellales bacterium]